MRLNTPSDPLGAKIAELEQRLRILETRGVVSVATPSPAYLELEGGGFLETEDGSPIELEG